MSWIGGKKSSRDIIIPRFPLYYEKYIEVFGGGGWILFAKPPGNDFEVFNDYSNTAVSHGTIRMAGKFRCGAASTD